MIVQYHTKYQIQLLKISENKIVDSAQIAGDVLVDAAFLERENERYFGEVSKDLQN